MECTPRLVATVGALQHALQCIKYAQDLLFNSIERHLLLLNVQSGTVIYRFLAESHPSQTPGTVPKTQRVSLYCNSSVAWHYQLGSSGALPARHT